MIGYFFSARFYGNLIALFSAVFKNNTSCLYLFNIIGRGGVFNDLMNYNRDIDGFLRE